MLTCGSVLVNTVLSAHVAGLGFPLKVNGRYWTHKVCQVPESHFSPFSGTVDSNQRRQIVYLSTRMIHFVDVYDINKDIVY